MKLRYKLTGFILVFTLSITTLFYLFGIWNQNKHLQKSAHGYIQDVEAHFHSLEDRDSKILLSALEVIVQDQSLKAVYLEKNRDRLYAYAQTLFQNLKNNSSITHFYFILPDGHVFLRMHDKKQYGDLAKRISFETAKATQKPASGIEFGKTGFALRAVMPYFRDGQLIGYVELGEEIDHFLKILKGKTNNEFVIASDKEYLNRDDWRSMRQNLGLTDNWDDMKKHVLLGSTDKGEIASKCFVEENMEKAEKGENIFSRLRLGDGDYFCGGIDLRDKAGRHFAELLTAMDFTTDTVFSQGRQKGLVLAAIILFLVSGSAGVIISRLVTGPILKLSGLAEAVGRGDLSQKVVVSGTDEIGQLGRIFNDMIEKRKQIEETQMFLLECGRKDDDFFESLASYLAEKLKMDFVCIDQLEPDGLLARTLAVYFDGKFEDNITYALKDTPCGDVVGQTVCCFPRDVRHLFPEDAVLQEMKADSYVGVTLWSSKMEPIGLVAVIGRRPLENQQLAEAILKLVAIRAGGELERKQVENEILRSKQFSESIINSLPGIFYAIDSKGTFIRVNDEFIRVSAYSQEEVLKMNPLDFFSEDEKKKLEDRIREVFEKGESSVEADFLSKHGNKTPYYFTGYRSLIDGKSLLVGVGINITNRRNAEKALRDSEGKYRSLFEESRDMIYISTYDGKFIDVNPAGVQLLCYPSKEALMPVAIRDIYADPNDREHFISLLSEHDYVADYVTKLLRKDGKQIEVSISVSADRDVQGKVKTVRGIIRDITEHRKIEAQLRQSQKMESVGTLAGGIAHDFNNILSAIVGYGQLAIMKMEPDNPYRKNIEHILTAADKAAYLTQGLLSFSRIQMSNRCSVDLNELLKKTEMFLRRVIGEDIEFRTSPHKNPIVVFADPNQIEQVLMNLAANARDAMPKGGNLTMSTEQADLDEEFSRRHGYGTPGSYGLITVSDSGMGMSEETRQRIFEPFFTTKEVGKGTGLGLAIIYGIIKQHDGFIDVYSEPGEGTTFRIYLPLIGPTIKEATQTAEPEYPAGGTETILLAEDDEMLMKLEKSVLEEFGYEVISAVDGEDAISKFVENKDRIDLLLTDLIMPKKSGKDVYDEIQKIRPGTKTIFVSGYSPDIVCDKASFEKDATIIFKPVSPMDLLKKVRSVLDKRNT